MSNILPFSCVVLNSFKSTLHTLSYLIYTMKPNEYSFNILWKMKWKDKFILVQKFWKAVHGLFISSFSMNFLKTAVHEFQKLFSHQNKLFYFFTNFLKCPCTVIVTVYVGIWRLRLESVVMCYLLLTRSHFTLHSPWSKQLHNSFTNEAEALPSYDRIEI